MSNCFCDPRDCSPPGSPVHEIFQARILEWIAISFSRGSSQPRDWTWVFCIAGRLFTGWAMREVTYKESWVPKNWCFWTVELEKTLESPLDCKEMGCWERLKAGEEGDNRGWDRWMASVTQWTWVWARSRKQWRMGKPGVLQSMGSQRVGHDWTSEQQQSSTPDTSMQGYISVKTWKETPSLLLWIWNDMWVVRQRGKENIPSSERPHLSNRLSNENQLQYGPVDECFYS